MAGVATFFRILQAPGFEKLFILGSLAILALGFSLLRQKVNFEGLRGQIENLGRNVLGLTPEQLYSLDLPALRGRGWEVLVRQGLLVCGIEEANARFNFGRVPPPMRPIIQVGMQAAAHFELERIKVFDMMLTEADLIDPDKGGYVEALAEARKLRARNAPYE